MTASSPVPKKFGMWMARSVKLTPPAIRPTIGMTMSLTKELTIVVKAPPTATPTARSTTEPRLINSMNSFLKLEPPLWTLAKVSLVFSLVDFSDIFTPLIPFGKIIKLFV